MSRTMPRTPPTERIGEAFEDVLAAAREGADWAVNILFRSLQPRLLRFLRAGLGHDADDVASQAWLEVARALPRFTGGEDDFAALLFTVARRRAADHRRAMRRRPASPGGDEALATMADSHDTEDDVIARLRGEDAARQIAAILPPEQAEIVLLRVVGGFSAEEVAVIVGRRAGTVRVLQHRALRRLAERLGDDM